MAGEGVGSGWGSDDGGCCGSGGVGVQEVGEIGAGGRGRGLGGSERQKGAEEGKEGG